MPGGAQKRKAALEDQGLVVEIYKRVEHGRGKHLGYLCLVMGQDEYGQQLADANVRLATEHDLLEGSPAGHKKFVPRSCLPWVDFEGHELVRESLSAEKAISQAEQAWRETQSGPAQDAAAQHPVAVIDHGRLAGGQPALAFG